MRFYACVLHIVDQMGRSTNSPKVFMFPPLLRDSSMRRGGGGVQGKGESDLTVCQKSRVSRPFARKTSPQAHVKNIDVHTTSQRGLKSNQDVDGVDFLSLIESRGSLPAERQDYND